MIKPPEIKKTSIYNILSKKCSAQDIRRSWVVPVYVKLSGSLACVYFTPTDAGLVLIIT